MSVIPPDVRQKKAEMCWAACMESWSRVAWYYNTTDQDALAFRYGNDPNGGLDTNGPKFSDFKTFYKLKSGFYPGGTITSAMANSWLNVPGYFIFLFQTGEMTSHALLAYACTDTELRTLDPKRGWISGGIADLPDLIVLRYDADA